MKITLLNYGSCGDVQPFLPLSQGLLPRCKMIIHHGGAGITSAGLRAGIPNIIVPFTANQPFWGNRVHAIGAGPKPILVRKLSVEKLMCAIARAEEMMFVSARRLRSRHKRRRWGKICARVDRRAFIQLENRHNILRFKCLRSY